MRMKSVPAGGYPPGKCAACHCSAAATKILPRGTEFPGSRGHVPLCASHVKKLALEVGKNLEDIGRQTTYSLVSEGGEQPPKAHPSMLSVVPAEKPESLAAETKEAEDVVALIQEFYIETQADYDFAVEALGDAKSKWGELEARKRRAVEPLNASLKEIRGWFKPPQDFYAMAELALKNKIAEFHRRVKEKQDLALAEAQAAFHSGDAQRLDVAVAVAAQSEVVQSPQVTITKFWTWEVEDEDAIPREYMMPNHTAISNVVKKFQRETKIPGIRVKQDERVIKRSA